MTSNGWANIVLVVTVFAPLVTVLFTVGVALPVDDRRWPTVGCAITAAGALGLLVSGQHPSIARLQPDDLALVAMAGTALLALAVHAAARPGAVAALVTVAACGIGAGASGRPSTVALALSVAIAVALLGVSRDTGMVALAVLGGGAIVAAAGLRSGGHGGATAVVVGVTVVAMAAAARPRYAATVVVPAALVLGLRVAPTLSSTSAARWVAAVLGGMAVVAVFAPAVVSGWRPPAAAVALVPWVLAAAVAPVPGAAGAARAMAAGVVLAVALGGELALTAVVPGAAVLAYTVADASGWPRVVLGCLVVATLAGVLRPRAAATGARVRVVDGAALVLGAWLVARPTAWTWAHVPRVDAYSDGTVLAMASGLIAVVSLSSRGGIALGPIASALVVDDDDRGVELPRRPVAAVAVTTAIVVALLVRSARL